VSAWYGATISPAPGEPLVVVAEGWDPRSGPSYTYEWRGREFEVRLMMAEQKALGRKTDLRRPDDGEGKWVLQATASANETTDVNTPLAVKWSLKRNLLEKHLWEHPSIVTVLKTIPHLTDEAIGGSVFSDGSTAAQQNFKQLAKMKKDFDAFIRGDEKTTNALGDDQTLDLVWLRAYLIDLEILAQADVFARFLAARLRGVEAFPTWSWVLRKTVIVPKGSALRPSKDNVDKMFTLEALKVKEQLTDQEIIGKMPPGFWLKTPCEADISDEKGADKYEFEQEYWHAETFEKFIYGEAITS
jgi:hypothetical protein